ncbi:MAG TPA: NfeD family protein, partial [Solirubrobacterales bacterium]|nr:NfeD family protein [Solirubrobacterales bacterium]
YIAFAVLGCGYVLVTALLGHFMDAFDGGGDGHGAPDAGGHGAESYGVDAGGHGSVSAHDAGVAAFHFPFFSPLALATLVGAIGAFGLIAKHGFRAGDTVSLLVSLPAAFATAYAVTYAGWRLVQGSRGSSAIRLAELVGAPAEVLTPIPAGGLGEVAAVVAGQRYAGPAREAEGREVPRGAVVTVVRVIGSTLVVSVAKP